MKVKLVTEEKLDMSLTEAKTELRGWFEEIKSEIFDRLDNISGQLETIRDEQTIGYHQFKGLEEKVDNHETRITALEPQHS